MAVLPWWDRLHVLPELPGSAPLALRESARRRQLVSTILLVVAGFQLVSLPGAISDHSSLALGTVVLGLVICGVAMLFNRGGKAVVSSVLLIVVIDLGCGLMLLTSPMGLDVANLPVFDVLIVSELIAVSLLPAVSVFPIALGNILFILGDIALQPHTPALNQLLTSGMAYDVIVQPIGLQIIVAVVTYLWVRSALRAIARADRAEEVAELKRRDAERTHQLEMGIQQLLQTQVRAANGDLMARANLGQDNLLWQVGVSLNMLLTRLQKAGRETSRIEHENQQLRGEVARLTQLLHEVRAVTHTTPGRARRTAHGSLTLASMHFSRRVSRVSSQLLACTSKTGNASLPAGSQAFFRVETCRVRRSGSRQLPINAEAAPALLSNVFCLAMPPS